MTVRFGKGKMIETPKAALFPVLPLRDIVVFPHMIVPLFVGREKSIRALEEVMRDDKQILLVAQKNAGQDDPGTDDIYRVGTVSSVLQLLKLPDGTVKVLVEGNARAEINSFIDNPKFFQAHAEILPETDSDPHELEALGRAVVTQFEQYVKLNKKVPPEVLVSLSQIDDPSKLADTVAAHLTLKISDKQELLETPSLADRLERLYGFMESEISVLQVEKRIRSRVKRQMEKTQREYYLNEQMKAIQKELGELEDGRDEVSELEERIKKTRLTKEAREKALTEVKKLRSMSPMSAEATVVRNYLDWMLSIPWKKRSKVSKDIKRAQQILDEDHFGLEKVKERILEYLAVQQRVDKIRGPILCLVGPPGVGKTSLGKSLARSTGRNFVRVSLGGIRDDPSSALLEVLDPEQNSNFNDHYLEVDYDLSDVMFVCTANTLRMPPALQDRLEIIRIPGYTEDEKLEIAKRYLVPKQLEAHGLKADEWSMSDDALLDLLRYYTREAGVRNLEREIANLIRKATKEILLEDKEKIRVSRRNLERFAGVRKFRYGEAEHEDLVGVSTGLAWTEVGGELLSIEAVTLPGKGRMTTTGKLGDVMQESVQAAKSYVRSRSTTLGIIPPTFDKLDIHVHVPEGATPKDGPSAGVAMVTSIVSVLTKIPVKASLAMTGEITLRGRVLPIGGLKEKLLAALRGGIKTVVIPKDNEKDLAEIPDNVKKSLSIMAVSDVDEVIRLSLVRQPEAVEWMDVEPATVARSGGEGGGDTTASPPN